MKRSELRRIRYKLYNPGPFQVGDKVRDLGRYASYQECDGVVVDVERFKWTITKWGWYAETMAFCLVVKFRDGSRRYYNPHGSPMVNGEDPMIVKR